MAVRTRNQARRNPTTKEILVTRQRERKQLWTQEDAIPEENLTVGQKTARLYMATVDVNGDNTLDDKARLLARILAYIDYTTYFAVEDEGTLLGQLLDEYVGFENRFLDPARKGLRLGEISEAEARDYLRARRARVCLDLPELHRVASEAQQGEKDFTKTKDLYISLVRQITKLMFNVLLVLRHLGPTLLEHELTVWGTFVQRDIHQYMTMFATIVSDEEIEKPVKGVQFDVEQSSVITEARYVPLPRSEEGEQSQEEAAGESFVQSNIPQPTVPPMAQLAPSAPMREPLAPRVVDFDVRRTLQWGVDTVNAVETKPTVGLSDASNQFEATQAYDELAQLMKMMQMKMTPQDRKTINDTMARHASQSVRAQARPDAAKKDALDTLAGKFDYNSSQTSAAAYGDASALAQYNQLPNVQLPPFYGNTLEFPKWWQMFICLVDLNPKIPQIMKLHILQKSLKGNAEYLTHQVTFSPHSYETLKTNVQDAFDDADAALRQLTERIRGWPTLKKNDYKQLAEFTGFASNYVMQLMTFEEGVAFNPRNVVNDLYGKFNPTMMGDYRREWAQNELLRGKQTDRQQVIWLLDWLKEQLRVARSYYHADPNRTPIQLGMPSGIAMEFKTNQNKGKSKNSNASASDNAKKTTTTTADNLYASADPTEEFETVYVTNTGRGRGRGGNRGGQRGRGGGSARGRGRGRGASSAPSNRENGPLSVVSSVTNKNGNGQKSTTDRSDSGYDMFPCLFCGQQQHPARSCTQNMKPDTVYLKAIEAHLCLNCLKSGHYASACPHQVCSVDGCQSRHHKMMHGHGTQPQRKS